VALRSLTPPSVRGIIYSMADSVQVRRNLRAAMKEALRIQKRFVAEPVFAKTGKGYLKSEGVSTLQKIKANLRRKASLKGHDQHLARRLALGDGHSYQLGALQREKRRSQTHLRRIRTGTKTVGGLTA